MTEKKDAPQPVVVAYKGFGQDWKCRDFQYAPGESYEHKGKAQACESGFHACEYPLAAAPDLLNELKQLRRAYVNLLENGRDRIISLGGQCDDVTTMEAADPALRSVSALISKLTGSAPEGFTTLPPTALAAARAFGAGLDSDSLEQPSEVL